MIRTGFLLIILVSAANLAQPDSTELRSAGKSLYVSLCQRCHGETGDAEGYPGITPLSGITLRIPGQEIASLSAPFVGRTFEGREAEALTAYLGTLKGEKGFERPGYLVSPDLLEKKLGETTHYRVVDARPEKEYRALHIPNAVTWNGSDPSAGALERLARLGAGPQSFVVIYDSDGGPPAAAIWSALRAAGHERAAVLDGGFKAWSARNFPVSARPVAFPPLHLTAQPEAQAEAQRDALEKCAELPELRLVLGEAGETGDVHFDWRRTMDEKGVLPAAEVRAYVQSIGLENPGRYAIRGNSNDLGYLLFLLHLLGSAPSVSRAGDALCVP